MINKAQMHVPREEFFAGKFIKYRLIQVKPAVFFFMILGY